MTSAGAGITKRSTIPPNRSRGTAAQIAKKKRQEKRFLSMLVIYHDSEGISSTMMVATLVFRGALIRMYKDAASNV
jgi:hypothetical protein